MEAENVHTYTDADFECQEKSFSIPDCQNPQPNYWAKLTTFRNGGFELAVTVPPLDSHHKFTGSVFHGRQQNVINPKRNEKTEEQLHAENLARSVRRSRQKVRHTIKAGEFDHLLTLNYRENVTDSDRVKADFKRFVRMVVARFPEWKYVAVRELQERGAIHLHLAVKGRQPVQYLRNCWYVAIGGSIYDLGENTKGQINVRAPSRNLGRKGKSVRWRVEKLASYLSKYMGKEFDLNEHHSKRYWHSKSIVKPDLHKFWLAATNFQDCIKEAHDIVHRLGASDMNLRSADSWQYLYITGSDLCPF